MILGDRSHRSNSSQSGFSNPTVPPTFHYKNSARRIFKPQQVSLLLLPQPGRCILLSCKHQHHCSSSSWRTLTIYCHCRTSILSCNSLMPSNLVVLLLLRTPLHCNFFLIAPQCVSLSFATILLAYKCCDPSRRCASSSYYGPNLDFGIDSSDLVDFNH